MVVLLGGAMMQSMAWCRVADGMCPKAPSRSLRIVVVKGDCSVRVSIEAFVTYA